MAYGTRPTKVAHMVRYGAEVTFDAGDGEDAGIVTATLDDEHLVELDCQGYTEYVHFGDVVAVDGFYV